MKKRILLGGITFLFFSVVTFNYATRLSDSQLSFFTLSEVEALAQNENGCINKPGNNNGHCATDGYYYLCENQGSHDCVIGVYP